MSEQSPVVEQGETVPPEAVIEFLTFRLDGARYALEVGRVGQVVWRPATTRVPRAPPGVYGAATVEGSVAVAVDTYDVVGLDRAFAHPGEAYLVLLNHEATPQPVGLLVEAVDGIERHHVETVEPPREGETRLDDRWFRATIAGEGSRATPVFDSDRLVAAIHPAGTESHTEDTSTH